MLSSQLNLKGEKGSHNISLLKSEQAKLNSVQWKVYNQKEKEQINTIKHLTEGRYLVVKSYFDQKEL